MTKLSIFFQMFIVLGMYNYGKLQQLYYYKQGNIGNIKPKHENTTMCTQEQIIFKQVYIRVYLRLEFYF